MMQSFEFFSCTVLSFMLQHCYIIILNNAAVRVPSQRTYRMRSKFTFFQAHPDARAARRYSFEIKIVVIFTFSSLIARVICFATE